MILQNFTFHRSLHVEIDEDSHGWSEYLVNGQVLMLLLLDVLFLRKLSLGAERCTILYETINDLLENEEK